MVKDYLSSLGSRDNIPLLVAFAVVLSVFLAWVAPSEATLGQAVKLVYVHAALMWVAFGLITIGGLAGALFLVWRRPSLAAWSNGSVVTAVGLLAGTGLLGIVTAKITWGGVNWAEPRLFMLGEIIIIGAAAVLVALVTRARIPAAAANFAFAAVAWWLLLRTERVVHPASPIFSSESAAIKIFPLLITASLAFAGLQIVRSLVKPSPDVPGTN